MVFSFAACGFIDSRDFNSFKLMQGIFGIHFTVKIEQNIVKRELSIDDGEGSENVTFNVNSSFFILK